MGLCVGGGVQRPRCGVMLHATDFVRPELRVFRV